RRSLWCFLTSGAHQKKTLEDGIPAPDGGHSQEAHLRIVKAAGKLERERGGDRRSQMKQRSRREIESEVRSRAVAFQAEVVGEGRKKKDAAKWLELPRRTISRWEEGTRGGTGSPSLRGRPLSRSPRMVRNILLAFLKGVGSGVGMRPLRTIFPEMSRGEVLDLLKRYRQLERRAKRGSL